MWHALQILLWTTNPWTVLSTGYVIGGVCMFVGLTAHRVLQLRRG